MVLNACSWQSEALIWAIPFSKEAVSHEKTKGELKHIFKPALQMAHSPALESLRLGTQGLQTMGGL